MKSIRSFLLLEISFLVYSLGSIPSKLASNEPVLSFKFIFFLGLQLLSLAIYAVLWQQVLKRMPLVVAFANKGITIVWSMIIGVLCFNEKVSTFNVIGAVIIMIGIILMVIGEQKDE